MTTKAKWLMFIPSATIVTMIFSAGVYVGHAPDAQAYVQRREFERYRDSLDVQHFRDSVTVVVAHSETIVRLSRIERLVYKMACRQFPTECTE